MKGKDCKLAVRYQKKPYYVQGTSIDDHGDAHEDKGFCSVIRKARVQGKLKGDKFVVTYFKLIN